MSSPSQDPLRGQQIEVTIEKIAAKGHGMARVNGIPLFVEGAIPGQTVEVRILKRGGNYAEGKLLRVLKGAPGEIRPRCKHFGRCGGCIWQHLPYDRQILYKEDIVRETLEHVTFSGTTERGDTNPVAAQQADPEEAALREKMRKSLHGRVLRIIPSPQVFHYRNKLELSFGYGSMRSEADGKTGKRLHFDEQPGIGFHQPGQWATILPIEECHLYDEQITATLQRVSEFMEETQLPVYNPKTHKGVLKTLLLRRGINTGEQMVCFIVQARKKQLEPLFGKFQRFGQHPSVTSLLVVEDFGKSGAASSLVSSPIHVLKGKPTIRERLFDLEFDLSPFSFFQTNTLAAEKLYQAVARAADLSGRETVLDCYCGIGAIGQYLSRFAKKVVGVESNASAIEDALKSAGHNRIGNISFYRGVVEQVLNRQLKPGGKYAFDCVILDPPRAGLHKNVIGAILGHQPPKIIYVSCNTSTFARDLGALLEGGYELRMVQPVDLFPHTAHVETVALLQRK